MATVCLFNVQQYRFVCLFIAEMPYQNHAQQVLSNTSFVCHTIVHKNIYAAIYPLFTGC